MEELEREIQQIATRFFPPRTDQDLAIVAGAGGLVATSLSRIPIVHAASPAPSDTVTVNGAGPLLRRFRAWERRKIAMAVGGAFALLLCAVVLAATSKHGNKDAGRRVAMGPPPPALVTPPVIAPPVPPPEPLPTNTLAPTKPGDEPGGEKTATEETDDSDSTDGSESKTAERAEPETEPTTTTRPSGAGRSARALAADNRKQLEEAERLLRAERFTEARGIFTRLAKSRRDRGPALVGLAEISFQEKHYEDAVKSATRAADRGGGVRARVLLGDAHFRLNQFKEAAKAYEGALKLDPRNASARSGLALANKRM
jgi:tetratricopeptide (TPR) repeat protein